MLAVQQIDRWRNVTVNAQAPGPGGTDPSGLEGRSRDGLPTEDMAQRAV